MNKDELFNIAKQFKITGEPIDIKSCDSGHINKTYEITLKKEEGINKKYILQYVDTNVFKNLPELMSNTKKVTSYIKERAKQKNEYDKRTTIKLFETKDENPYMIYNKNWRMERFITDTVTYLATDDLNILYQAGKAVGNFQKYLDGFPTEELYEIIPKFHYTPNRYNQLKEALNNEENKQKRPKRFEIAKESIEFLANKNRTKKTNIIVDKLEKRDIPLRVTHNDTKLSNILFDSKTKEAVCLIDLDTVMPGSIVYDFGEGVRTGITNANEDEPDLTKIYVDINRFEAYTKGFLENAKDIITEKERKLLVLGAWMMTYENAMRFVTDYLNGDKYFRVDENIENHNLIRAKAQIEIMRQMEEKQKEMEGMVEKYGI